MMQLKNKIINNIKNIPGWKSNRKLLAFAVDDYGNIRLSSLEAKQELKDKGVVLNGRFDHFDALDTRQDYEQLFNVLQSVKDKNNKAAIFTSYAVTSNTNFEETVKQSVFVPEDLDETYARLSKEDPENFEDAHEILQDGIQNGLIKPQFHGREHLNVFVFNNLLRDNNHEIIVNLRLKSQAGIPNHKDFPKVRFSEAFSFWDKREIENHKTIIQDGLNRFEKVYGYRSITFTPPSLILHPELYSFIENHGIRAIDKPRAHQVHLGNGCYKKEKNTFGVNSSQNHVTIVRNCMFEPNSRSIDWVNYTFNQIRAAFFWGKPAIISSHRVNFCGLIDSENRRKGLESLRALLKKVVKTWPEVEFVGIDELAEIINNNANR